MVVVRQFSEGKVPISHKKVNKESVAIVIILSCYWRLLPPCDARYFKRGAERVKKYRYNMKEDWVEVARRVIEAFFLSLDPQAENFLDLFDNV